MSANHLMPVTILAIIQVGCKQQYDTPRGTVGICFERRTMLDVLQSDYCAQKLRLLGDPERLLIIQVLRDGPKNVGEIAERTGQKLANVSHHLKALREGELVECKREGRFILYRLLPGTYIESPSGKSDHLDIGCCRLEIPKSTNAKK